MNPSNQNGCFRIALGAALWLAASGAFAAAPAPQDTAAKPEIVLAQSSASSAPAPAAAPAANPLADAAAARDPLQARAWRAAAEGAEPLRRFLWRTRMIFNYYVYDFSVPE